MWQSELSHWQVKNDNQHHHNERILTASGAALGESAVWSCGKNLTEIPSHAGGWNVMICKVLDSTSFTVSHWQVHFLHVKKKCVPLMFYFLYYIWGWYPQKQCTGVSLIPGQISDPIFHWKHHDYLLESVAHQCQGCRSCNLIPLS